MTSSTGHGWGLRAQNSRSSSAQSAGTQIMFAWAYPGAQPAVGAVSPARKRARASAASQVRAWSSTAPGTRAGAAPDEPDEPDAPDEPAASDVGRR